MHAPTYPETSYRELIVKALEPFVRRNAESDDPMEIPTSAEQVEEQVFRSTTSEGEYMRTITKIIRCIAASLHIPPDAAIDGLSRCIRGEEIA